MVGISVADVRRKFMALKRFGEQAITSHGTKPASTVNPVVGDLTQKPCKLIKEKCTALPVTISIIPQRINFSSDVLVLIQFKR